MRKKKPIKHKKLTQNNLEENKMQPKQNSIQQSPGSEITIEMEYFKDPLDIIPFVPRFFEQARFHSVPEFETFIAQMRSKMQIASVPKIRTLPPRSPSTFTLPVPRDEFGEDLGTLERILNRLEAPAGAGNSSSEIKININPIWSWLKEL